MRSFKYSILGLLTLLASCTPSWETKQLERYAEGRNQFDAALTNHFPELDQSKLISFSGGFPAGAYALRMAYFTLHQKNSDNVIKELEDKLNTLTRLNINDSTLIIIGDKSDYSNLSDGIPVPNFKKMFNNDTSDLLLPASFELFILDNSPGYFLEAEHLTSQTNLPENWRNGYSKGYAINKESNEIIYWMCAW